eukprot:GHVH01017366.1.p1 GENE.GHVH01017366.1~~GHVH01017366.1.p1  ORF type:complete len:609 (+),score=79.89 GHVH01017366.1:62-1888(+)
MFSKQNSDVESSANEDLIIASESSSYQVEDDIITDREEKLPWKKRLKNARTKITIQVIILSVCNLIGPALYIALKDSGRPSMNYYTDYGGKKGMDSESIDGIVSVSSASSSYFSGIMFNRVGPKPLAIVGLVGHILYEAFDYFVNKSGKLTWISILMSLLLGLFTGIMSVSLAGILLALPKKDELGYSIAIFRSIALLAPFICGCIQLLSGWKFYSNNYINESQSMIGQVFPRIYIQDFRKIFLICFIVVVSVVGVICLTIMAPVYLIRKDDGTLVEFQRWAGIYNDLKESAYLALDPFVCKMFIVFIYSNFTNDFIYKYIIKYMFNIRSQGLATIMFSITGIAASFLCGWLLDIAGSSIRMRMIAAWRVLSIVSLLGWVMTIIVLFNSCNGAVDKNRDDSMIHDHNMVYALAWFPEQDGVSGCKFLDSNSELQYLQCVHDGFYGWCNMDIMWIYTGRVCSRDLSFWDVCHEVDINYASQAIVILIALLLLAVQQGFLHVMILWMIKSMSGPRNTSSVRYLSVYYALQSVGTSISWFVDIFDFMLYRYQGIISAILCFFCMGAIYSAIDTIEKRVYKQQNMEKDEVGIIDYTYYYSYYDSGSLDESKN